jgi:hypothetical protein
MTTNDIATYRLFNQQLVSTKFTTAPELVSYFGAMQAQDYAMAKWAIGLRLSAAESEIENAINKGDIIRTHILRPTWHFVSATDVRWMLELTAPHIKRANAIMCRKLELEDKTLKRCKIIIEKVLRGTNLTREEIMLELDRKGIVTTGIRSALIMLDAELDGLVCNGPVRGKQFTYALLDEKIPMVKAMSKTDALTELAKRYFGSHGPATLQDFSWWSGLSLTNAALGLEAIKSTLHSAQVDKQTYWFNTLPSNEKNDFKNILFLPAFDEFMVSYKDRSASLAPSMANETITGNGIFKPIIVAEGKVVGWWKRTFKKDSVLLEAHYFNSTKKFPKQVALKAAEQYGNYLKMKTIVQ